MRVRAMARIDKIKGTKGDDSPAGISNADSISGLGGNDTLAGGAGDGKLFGGRGDDALLKLLTTADETQAVTQGYCALAVPPPLVLEVRGFPANGSINE